MQVRPVSNLLWCCALGFMLSCLIGLGEVALEIWLVLHYTSIAELTGIMIYISYAFLASGALAIITGLLGFSGSIKMNRCFLLLSISLMVLSIVCQAAVWIATYIEQIQVVADLVDNLNGTTQYYKALDHHYNCQLQNSSMGEYAMQLEICVSFLSRQLWTYVYSLLVLCLLLICLQSIVMLMAAKLNRQLKKRNRKVASSTQLDNAPHHETPARITRAAHPSTVSQPQEQPPPNIRHTLQPAQPPPNIRHTLQSAQPPPPELYSIAETLPPTEPPPPSAPPPRRPQLRPISAPASHPPPPQYSYSCPNFDPALLPNAPQRGNFNHTNPLPRIPSYGEQYPMYQQNHGTTDWGDVVYEQSRM